MGDLLGKTRLLLEEVLVRPAEGAHPVVYVGPNTQWRGHYTVKKHRPSDDMLNQGPDSRWSLKTLQCSSKKSRGVTLASWPNSPIDLWPSWPPNHPHRLIGFIILSLLHQEAGVWWALWCNMVAVASSRLMLHIGGVEEISPLYVNSFECLEKRYINVINYYTMVNITPSQLFWDL